MNQQGPLLPTYSRLASIYDAIMSDVDYLDWSDYIESAIRMHHGWCSRILELACGTGTMALELEERDDWHITATDGSEQMIRIARKKGEARNSSIDWSVQDMTSLSLPQTFDAVYMVFDSLNYLHHEQQVLKLLRGVKTHLAPQGIFVFDFTTPLHSAFVADKLNTFKTISPGLTYHRQSSWQPEARTHTNRFLVEQRDTNTGEITDRFEEVHVQRIWQLDEIRSIIERSGLAELAAYEDFELEPAGPLSERITMVLHNGS